MVRLTETFHWMFEDDRWRLKIFFQGLILLIPVVGVISLLGWMMVTCDNLLDRHQDMAPVGLHLKRGVKLLGIALVYWIGLGVPYSLLLYLNAGLGGVAALSFLAQLYNLSALLLYAFLLVPVFVATDRGGFTGGLDLIRIGASVIARPGRTAVAGLVVIVAVIIGFLGFAVIVAAPFTLTYAAAVVATIAAWWSLAQPERTAGTEPPLEPPAPSPPPAPFRPPQLERETAADP